VTGQCTVSGQNCNSG